MLAWLKRLWLRYRGQPLASILRDSGRWRRVSREFRARNPRCALCRSNKSVEAHHIVPWHRSEVLRYDEDNLISLCRDDHFKFGHFNNWKASNPGIRSLALFIEIQRSSTR